MYFHCNKKYNYTNKNSNFYMKHVNKRVSIGNTRPVSPNKTSIHIIITRHIPLHLCSTRELQQDNNNNIFIVTEEESIPTRVSKMGTACNKFDAKHIERLKSDKWDEIVPVTALRPGYEETRLNFQKVIFEIGFIVVRKGIVVGKQMNIRTKIVTKKYL